METTATNTTMVNSRENIEGFIWSTYRKPEGYTESFNGKHGKHLITFKDNFSVEVVMTKQQRVQFWRTRINKDILKIEDLGCVTPR